MRKSQLLIGFVVAITLGKAIAQVEGLPAEISDRKAADAQLQHRINTEAAARMTGDAMLDGRINAEAVSRMQAIDELRQNMGGTGGGNSGGGTMNVNCNAGGSVAQALAAGATRIIVQGTCNESITVSRDDVILQGDPSVGGGINGPDSNTNTVVVTGHRVTIEALTVTGGRNGISGVGAGNLMLRNCTVQSVGRTGIVYATGSNGTMDRCTVQYSGFHGVTVDSVSHLAVFNSNISNNARNGISVSNASTARIGFTERSAEARNTINDNGGSGITVGGSAYAAIAMNEIARNGSFGVSVFQATATIVGGNAITDNKGVGVSINGSKVVLGEPGFGLSTSVNHISGNGNQATGGGVIAFLGSSIIVRDAEIVRNNGAGLLLSLRSQGQLFSTRIENNASDGIRMLLGSALLPLAPVTTVSSNAGLGIQCFDSESSIVNTSAPTVITVSGNAAGNIAAACTTFDAGPLPLLPPS